MRQIPCFPPLLLSLLVLVVAMETPVAAAVGGSSALPGGEPLATTSGATAAPRDTVGPVAQAHLAAAVEDLGADDQRPGACGATRSALTAVASNTEPGEVRRCCFNNPSFHGTCVVEVGPQETCQIVLDYLNNPRSTGRTYCGNTSIRGGWKQVPCESGR